MFPPATYPVGQIQQPSTTEQQQNRARPIWHRIDDDQVNLNIFDLQTTNRRPDEIVILDIPEPTANAVTVDDQLLLMREQFTAKVFGTMLAQVAIAFGALITISFAYRIFSITVIVHSIIVTLMCCVAVIIFAKYTTIDLTLPQPPNWTCHLVCSSMGLFLIAVLIYAITITKQVLTIAMITIAVLLALLFLCVFALNTQMIFGGRAIAIPIEDYSSEALSLSTEAILIYVCMHTIIVCTRTIRYFDDATTAVAIDKNTSTSTLIPFLFSSLPALHTTIFA